MNSTQWVTHFTQNAKQLRINWSQKPQITESRKHRILRSLQAWQLGETSEGSHLLAAARRHADKTHDYVFPIAVELFIREEQKHGNNLGCYLDLIGEKRVTKDWGDTLFRKVRYFNTSMELWTLAVLTVESAAELYYASLKDVAGCPLLGEICDDILLDEAPHIEFQTERLLQIFHDTPAWSRPMRFELYRFFFLATAVTIWFAHKSVLKGNDGNFWGYMRGMVGKFRANFHRVRDGKYSEIYLPTVSNP